MIDPLEINTYKTVILVGRVNLLVTFDVITSVDYYDYMDYSYPGEYYSTIVLKNAVIVKSGRTLHLDNLYGRNVRRIEDQVMSEFDRGIYYQSN